MGFFGELDPRRQLGLVLVASAGLTGCANRVDLRSSQLDPLAEVSLEQELLIHQWGGWHRVALDPKVAATQAEALRLDQLGQDKEAVEVLEQGLKLWPDSATLLECRAALCGAMGYWRAAECGFVKALEEQPGRASTWEALARSRQELGLWNGAREARKAAQRLALLP